jgi:hypothetical protein
MTFETHLLWGSVMLLGHAVVLLGSAIHAWRRDFGPRREERARQALLAPRRLSRYAAF